MIFVFLVSTIRLLEKIGAQTKHLMVWYYIDFMENFGGRSRTRTYGPLIKSQGI